MSRTVTILATRKARNPVKRVFTLKPRESQDQWLLDATTDSKGKYGGPRLYGFMNTRHGHRHIPLDTMPPGFYELRLEGSEWLWFGPNGQRWHNLEVAFVKQYGRRTPLNHPTKFQLS